LETSIKKSWIRSKGEKKMAKKKLKKISDMVDVLQIEFHVRPKNFKKVEKYFKKNMHLFERVSWTKLKAKIL